MAQVAAKRIPRDFKPRRRQPARFTGWVGAVCGLGLGLCVAAVVYLKDHRSDAPTTTAARTARHRPRTESPEGDAQESGAPEEPAKSYDFYDQLPKFEVVVPEREKDVKRDVRDVPETRRGTYVLQAGSYKNFADADRIRAQLALQGVESKVQKVSVDSDTWHRIRIGPISNLQELNKLRATLRKADVDVLVIRVGD
jgi:cell division protein FtsN